MAKKTTAGPTKVKLTESAQEMVNDVKALDVEEGRAEPSDAYTANRLIQLGYVALKSKRTTTKGAR